eukprot:scaffold8700_cov62-Phaeocystis_antarctica.AAC.2
MSLTSLSICGCHSPRVTRGIDAKVRRQRAQLVHVERRQRLVVDDNVGVDDEVHPHRAGVRDAQPLHDQVGVEGLQPEQLLAAHVYVGGGSGHVGEDEAVALHHLGRVRGWVRVGLRLRSVNVLATNASGPPLTAAKAACEASRRCAMVARPHGIGTSTKHQSLASGASGLRGKAIGESARTRQPSSGSAGAVARQ